jgi:hypothetical protein
MASLQNQPSPEQMKKAYMFVLQQKIMDRIPEEEKLAILNKNKIAAQK